MYTDPLRVHSQNKTESGAAIRRLLPQRIVLFSFLVALCLSACVAPGRTTYDANASRQAIIAGFDDIRVYADALGKQPNINFWLPRAGTDTVSYLSISSGGAAGAFSVGVLKGWSDSGTRPQFDIVSGVSTGALIAPFAFLGPEYDNMLVDLYTDGTAEALTDMKFLPRGLLGPSLLKQEPLRHLIETHLTAAIVDRVAAEHHKGRRLLVLTTNLDSQRAVSWNMGEIAASTRPDKVALFQNVILASASIPGLYPAVLIKARSDDLSFEEMHSDGGAASQILTFPDDWLVGEAGDQWPVDRRLQMYILVNNALMPEFSQARNNSLAVIARAYSVLVKAQTRSALAATYAFARQRGIGFHVASIEEQVPFSIVDPFDTAYMNVVFQLGYCGARDRTIWRSHPAFSPEL